MVKIKGENFPLFLFAYIQDISYLYNIKLSDMKKRQIDMMLAKFLGAVLHSHENLNPMIQQWDSVNKQRGADFPPLHNKIASGNELHFSTDITWLIAVLNKFIALGTGKFAYDVTAQTEYISICKIITNLPVIQPIDDIYQQAAAAVLWYNEQKLK